MQRAIKFRSNAGHLSLLALIVILFGGSAQFFLISDLVTRLAALCMIVLIAVSGSDLKPSKAASAFFFLAVAIPVIQLVPIPYELWKRLPGMAESARLLEAVSSTQAMRAVSIAPSRTLDSLLFMVIPLAGFLFGYRSDIREVKLLSFVLVLTAVLSATIGSLQLIAGDKMDLYPYRVTNEGSAVGIFANRNHQALFLMIGAVFSLRIANFHQNEKMRTIVRFFLFVMLSAGALLTQSRAGALLLVMALVLIFIAARFLKALPLYIPSSRMEFVSISAVLALGVMVLLIVGGPVADRLSQSLDEPFNRFDGIVIATSALSDFWLTGSGMGTFEWLAPSYEDQAALTFAYWNHAHNDWLQLLAESGAAGGLLMLLVGYFIQARVKNIVRTRSDDAERYPYLILAFICIMLALIHSLVDYPLRTASISFVIFWCAGMIDASHVRSKRRIWRLASDNS